MAADLRERVARAIARDENGDETGWQAWLPEADAVLAELKQELQPQAEPVAWDDWIGRCPFWVTFDGETTHQLAFGGCTADANGINSMTFELSGIVSRDDLDELEQIVVDRRRVLLNAPAAILGHTRFSWWPTDTDQ